MHGLSSVAFLFFCFRWVNRYSLSVTLFPARASKSAWWRFLRRHMSMTYCFRNARCFFVRWCLNTARESHCCSIILLLYIIFAYTVDHDIRVDVPAAVMPVRLGLFIVLENEIPLPFAVISIFNCYVFQYRHEDVLWNCLYAAHRQQSCPPFLRLHISLCKFLPCTAG